MSHGCRRGRPDRGHRELGVGACYPVSLNPLGSRPVEVRLLLLEKPVSKRLTSSEELADAWGRRFSRIVDVDSDMALGCSEGVVDLDGRRSRI